MPCCQRSREPAKLAWKARASRTASTCSRCGEQRNSHEREGCLSARLCDEPGRCEDERPENRKRWTIGDGESRATTHFARREACRERWGGWARSWGLSLLGASGLNMPGPPRLIAIPTRSYPTPVRTSPPWTATVTTIPTHHRH